MVADASEVLDILFHRTPSCFSFVTSVAKWFFASGGSDSNKQ